MTSRATVVGVVVLVVVAAGIGLLVSGGSEPYRLRLTIPTSGGLRKGSDVRIAGATIGKVTSMELGRGDAVDLELELDADETRIGRDATVAVRSNNLLGEKYLQIEPGDVSSPAPSGTVIPTSRVSFPVDLDEVLNVLDADTRTRLAILINQTGLALMGRRVDLNRMLRMAPRSVDRATRLLEQVTADNRALVDVIANTDRFIGRLARERRSVARLVDTAGETMRTVAARRPELRQTLRRAPATLATTRRFLGDLRATTVPLGPAARTIAATAPALTTTLAELGPFTRTAIPTLRQARISAPALSRLGTRATPVVRRAVAPVRSLRRVAQTAPPLSKALEDGIDGLLAALQGWSRAIQGRDSIGHVFRGHLNVSTEVIKSLISRLTASAPSVSRRRSPRHTVPVQRRLVPELSVPAPSRTVTPRVPLPAVAVPGRNGESVKKLLDFLLGP